MPHKSPANSITPVRITNTSTTESLIAFFLNEIVPAHWRQAELEMTESGPDDRFLTSPLRRMFNPDTGETVEHLPDSLMSAIDDLYCAPLPEGEPWVVCEIRFQRPAGQRLGTTTFTPWTQEDFEKH